MRRHANVTSPAANTTAAAAAAVGGAAGAPGGVGVGGRRSRKPNVVAAVTLSIARKLNNAPVIALVLLFVTYAYYEEHALDAVVGGRRDVAVRVERVVDGDTFVGTTVDDGRRAWFRLRRIDAPEMDQPFGPESKEALARLLLHGDLLCIPRPYGPNITAAIPTGTDGVYPNGFGPQPRVPLAPSSPTGCTQLQQLQDAEEAAAESDDPHALVLPPIINGALSTAPPARRRHRRGHRHYQRGMDEEGAAGPLDGAQLNGFVVQVVIWEKDVYGRYICDVFLRHSPFRKVVYVQEQMVRSGYAWAFSAFVPSGLLAEDQTLARAERLGLWSVEAPANSKDGTGAASDDDEHTPIEPWKHREAKRAQRKGEQAGDHASSDRRGESDHHQRKSRRGARGGRRRHSSKGRR